MFYKHHSSCPDLSVRKLRVITVLSLFRYFSGLEKMDNTDSLCSKVNTTWFNHILKT